MLFAVDGHRFGAVAVGVGTVTVALCVSDFAAHGTYDLGERDGGTTREPEELDCVCQGICFRAREERDRSGRVIEHELGNEGSLLEGSHLHVELTLVACGIQGLLDEVGE